MSQWNKFIGSGRVLALTASLIVCLSLFFVACLQDSASTKVPVRYTVLVRDGNTGKALEEASVEMTDENLESVTLLTNESGRVVFPSAESDINQFIVSKEGYEPTDTVDVLVALDTSLNVVLRTLNLALLPIGFFPAKTRVYSYTVSVFDAVTALPIPGASVFVRSGSKRELTVPTSSTGRAFLDSLPSSQNLFSISAVDYFSVDTVHMAMDSLDPDEVLCALRVLLNPSVSE